MICDIFFSICQNEVDGYLPSEEVMWNNFFSQVELADQLGFKTAWIAESHLSSEAQKSNQRAVIPHFKGEIGLNTDIYQLAHLIYPRTKQIGVGSAIRNILCNGGPIAQAEAARSFLQLRNITGNSHRRFSLGFAAGRFPYSVAPFGVKPKNGIEEKNWSILQHQIFLEASEIFLRLLEGECLSSTEIATRFITRDHFKSEHEWDEAFMELGSLLGYMAIENKIYLPHFYDFETLQVVPREVLLENFEVIIGSHSNESYQLANSIRPTKVFNLSITPPEVLEASHQLMSTIYNASGGPWEREYMPRTTMVFIEDSGDVARDRATANATAKNAFENYWRAMDGTVEPSKVARAVENALWGTPADIIDQAKKRFHPKDRVMFWFDFNEHKTSKVEKAMSLFAQKVMPALNG